MRGIVLPVMSDSAFLDEEDLWGQFAALNEHLLEVRSLIDQFCARHRFLSSEGRSPGRHSRIRFERQGRPLLWFDFQIVEGHRRDLTYELSCGAILDDGESRFYKISQCFSARPFEEVVLILPEQLENALRTMETWDARYLKRNGDRFA